MLHAPGRSGSGSWPASTIIDDALTAKHLAERRLFLGVKPGSIGGALARVGLVRARDARVGDLDAEACMRWVSRSHSQGIRPSS